jgi:hypothetical protein
MARRKLVVLGLLALAGVWPAQAHAAGPIEVYAVQDGVGASPCPQNDPCDLMHALSAAGANSGGGNVHVIGQLTWTGNTLDVGSTMGNPVNLVGNGNGVNGTVIDVNQPTALNVSYGSTVDNVRIRAQNVAVNLAYGSTLSHSVVQTTTGPSTGVGIAALAGSSNAAATLVNDSVSPTGASSTAVNVANGSPSQSLVITDSTLNGFSGVVDTHVPADIRRSTINASGGFGVDIEGGQTSYVSSSVIHMSSTSNGPVGVFVAGPTTVHLIEDTIDGVDSSGMNEAGVVASEGFMINASQAYVTDSIVRGFTKDLWAQVGHLTNQGGQITVSRSDFSTQVADTAPSSNPGHITDSGGNVDVAPAFVGRPLGDYRLRFDSPLIDAGGTAPLDPKESTTDRSGVTPRLTDGDNSGTAERDIGAFEYVFARPAASFTATPQPGLTGQTVSFDASASTYSIGPIADYAWDLDGNGSFETDTGADPHASHVYPAPPPGTVTVGLRVTGFDGGPAQTTRSVSVAQGPAPETTIEGGPSGVVSSNTASFTLVSSDPNATFECRLDGAAFAPCTSPKSYAALGGGPHTFEVRATDAFGDTDPTPASRTWTVAGTVTSLKLSPSAFFAATKGASVARKRSTGTKVTYVLSAAAEVRFTVKRKAAGRRSGKRCVKPTGKNTHNHKCVRLVPVNPSFTQAGKLAANTFHFTGRLGGKALRPASYVLLAKPGTKQAAFRVKR